MKILAIKALDDYKLNILAMPFGSESDLDSDGQYFDGRTKAHQDKFPEIPLVYYHGYDEENGEAPEPIYVGKAKYSHTDEQGHWYIGVLDKTIEKARDLWNSAKQGILAASSGSIGHLVRIIGKWIKEWPIAELSLIDKNRYRQPANQNAVALPILKAVYKQAGLELPEGFDIEPEAIVRDEAAEINEPLAIEKKSKDLKMDDKELKELEELRAEKAKRERDAEIKAASDEAVKAAKEKWEAEQAEAKKKADEEAAKANRLPDVPGNVQFNKMSELFKYDNLSVEDQAVLVGVLDAAKANGTSKRGASENAKKALAVKLDESKEAVHQQAKGAMKRAGIKANEIMQQDLSNYGDQWVGVAYSNSLWEAIRAGTFVAEMLPKIEVPAGYESISIPLESGDPTFYKVAEAATTASSGWPNATITSSQMGTANKSLTLAKMGARVLWSGELEEDSLIPFVSQLRMQLQKAGAEQLEHAIIDGDTATAASTNINDIGDASAQAGTELYLLFNGFRKSPLVTTTANSRSAGGLSVEDYLETVRLMGNAGLNAFDKTKVAFIIDPQTYWKSLELSEVKTRDVFANPTIENGDLTGIWGYRLYRSYFMHFKDGDRLANTSGKVDQTTVANNTTGSILAVRWDQWLLGYRRQMTMETTRIARADTTEIVALMRLGLTQRDTEAAAISYGVTV